MKNNDLNNIDKFDESTIENVYLPNPIPKELYEELYNKGIIRKSDLKKDTYYFGACRNASVALWNGDVFIYMRTKFGYIYSEKINHLEDDNGFDLFIPLKEVIPNNEEKIIL